MSTATPVAPCDFVVFGGTGDLAFRKLLPALYLRDRDGQLPSRPDDGPCHLDPPRRATDLMQLTCHVEQRRHR